MFSESLRILDSNTIDFMIDNLKQTIAEKDSQLAEKDNTITEKDNTIAEQASEITEKDNAIVNMSSEITEKDNAIANMSSEITEKDNTIANMSSEIAQLRAQLEKAQVQKNDEDKKQPHLSPHNEQLNAMPTSRLALGYNLSL